MLAAIARRARPGMILTVVAVCVNLFYLLSCVFFPSFILLVTSFGVEAALLFRERNNRTLHSVYGDVSPLFSLGKVCLYLVHGAGGYLFLLFILLEAYLLLFLRAGYYFQYLATAFPCLNYTNYGKLAELYHFVNQVDRYQQALFVRPVAYLVTLAFFLLPETIRFPGLSVWFIFLTVGIGKLLFLSFRFIRYTRSSSYRRDLKRHAAHHAPQVIVYVSGAPGSSYQLAQWIPVLTRLRQRVTVIAREKFWITDLPDSPLHTVFARGMADIEFFLTKETRLCLYPANAFKNTQMMRRAELKHIFINHGESDKVVNVSRLLGAYTKLYLAGPMARDRLLAAGIQLREDQYTYVGRPQTSIMLEPLTEQTSTVLYAPTWEGFDAMSNYSSVDSMALDIIRHVVESTGMKILFKPHPLTGTVKPGLQERLDEISVYLQKSGGGEYITDCDILRLMNRCDVMITDISSVMNDFLGTGRPYVVTNPTCVPRHAFEKQFPTVQGGYVIADSFEIVSVLEQINTTDPKKGDRERVRKYSLGDFPCSSLEKFQREIDADCAR